MGGWGVWGRGGRTASCARNHLAVARVVFGEPFLFGILLTDEFSDDVSDSSIGFPEERLLLEPQTAAEDLRGNASMLPARYGPESPETPRNVGE